MAVIFSYSVSKLLIQYFPTLARLGGALLVIVSDALGRFAIPLPAIAGVLFLIAVAMKFVRVRGHGDQTVLSAAQPLLGLVLFPAAIYATSAKRSAIAWRTVLGGFSLMVLFALFVTNFPAGKEVVRVIGDLVSSFMGFSVEGSNMIFGKELVASNAFAFQVLPTVIFFSAVVSVAFYAGFLQICILGVSSLLRFLLGASTVEAVACSGNIILGLCEVPLLLRPLIPHASRSELHVVCVCGYASVAGSVLAAFIEMGINPDSLLVSCFMSAPAAIALSKLSYPESEKAEDAKEATEEELQEALKSPDGSLVEAAGNGAANAVSMCANMAAMLIAFVSLIAALDSLTRWFMEYAGRPDINFSALCSYALAPAAFVLGVPWDESRAVGLLLAKKLVLNEFVAYADLSTLIKNRGLSFANAVPIQGLSPAMLTISPRAETIATFALCGFANLSSVGITLGSFCAISPERRSDVAPLVLRSMIVGFTVSLVNACVIALLQ